MNFAELSLNDLSERAKLNTIPTDKDKDKLLWLINKQLTEDDHIKIFVQFLHDLPKRIYTINQHATLFDLNDLNPEVFWKIYYYCRLCLQSKETDKIRKQMFELDNEQQQLLTQRLTQESQQLQAQMELEQTTHTQSKTGEVLNDNIPVYEDLRVDSLKTCSYSHYK